MLNNLPEGLTLLIYGGILLVARQVALYLMDLIMRHFIFTIEISERDSPEVYRWFTQWVAHQPFTESFTKLQAGLEEVTGNPQDRKRFQKAAAKVALKSGTGLPGFLMKGKPNVLFIPGFGTHLFFYKRALVVCSLSREKEGLLGASSGTAAGPNRVATLWGRAGNAPLVKEMILDARDFAHEQENSEVGVYMPDSRSQLWRRSLCITKIPFHSVILPEGVAEEILQDCTEFLNSKEWYVDKGVPYRRGYLLYGPPGSGKSSFVHALASEIGLDVCVVGVGSGLVTDQGLQLLLNAAPLSSILLLEDIDVLFPDRAAESAPEVPKVFRGHQESPSKGGSMLTLSGLLNALDGISGQQGRMVFMTTNFVDRLDEALIRSGRVDVKYLFGLPNFNQITRLFLKFFPEEKDLALEFADACLNKLRKRPSMADLQGHLLRNRKDAAQAMTNLVTSFKQ